MVGYTDIVEALYARSDMLRRRERHQEAQRELERTELLRELGSVTWTSGGGYRGCGVCNDCIMGRRCRCGRGVN